MLPYFIFKGIDSRDMGIAVVGISPIIRAAKKVNEIEIAGRNGILHEDTNTFQNYTKDIECAIKNRDKQCSFDDICSWLTGSGELIVSSEPDKIYRVFIKNQISIADVLKSFSKFLVQFDCFPFKYSVNKADEEKTLTAPTTVYNQGTVYSEPVITVYGTGDVTLTVNDTDYTLVGIDGYVTINSEVQEVYKDSTNKNNSFLAMNFPRFEVGANTISWTGNVTKIKVEPQWRWL